MNRLGNREKAHNDFITWYTNFKRKDTKKHYVHIRTTKNKEHSKFADVFDKRCGYCGMKYSLGKSYNIDHFKPKVHFPKLEHDINNFVYSCRTCNAKKGEINLDDDLHPVKNLGRYYSRTTEYKIIKNEEQYINSEEDVKASIDLMYDKVLSQRHVQLSYALEEYKGYIQDLRKRVDNEKGICKRKEYIDKIALIQKVIDTINKKHI